MVLGVAKKELGDTFAEVLRLLNVERALVVCGKEGLDEISCAGETWVRQKAIPVHHTSHSLTFSFFIFFPYRLGG